MKDKIAYCIQLHNENFVIQTKNTSTKTVNLFFLNWSSVQSNFGGFVTTQLQFNFPKQKPILNKEIQSWKVVSHILMLTLNKS